MSGSPRGLVSCKGERTGDPHGAVPCSEILEHARAKGRAMPLGCALRIAREALRHLEQAESGDDVGGPADLSPSTIFVGPLGDVLVLGAPDTERRSSRSEGEGSGLVSVGVVLYALLTGKQSVATTRDAELSGIAEPTPRLPLELRLILASALSGESDERFRAPLDFAEAIDDFAHHANVSLSSTELAGWLATLDIWPAHSGMFTKSELGADGSLDGDDDAGGIRRRHA